MHTAAGLQLLFTLGLLLLLLALLVVEVQVLVVQQRGRARQRAHSCAPRCARAVQYKYGAAEGRGPHCVARHGGGCVAAAAGALGAGGLLALGSAQDPLVSGGS